MTRSFHHEYYRPLPSDSGPFENLQAPQAVYDVIQPFQGGVEKMGISWAVLWNALKRFAAGASATIYNAGRIRIDDLVASNSWNSPFHHRF